MANTTNAPDPSTSFMRLPKEPIKAWAGFRIYRDMGPDRSMRETAINLGKDPGYISTLEGWSRKYEWVKRARAFDEYNERVVMQHAQEDAPLWAKRRMESLQANWDLAAELRDRLREMLAHPLTQVITKETDNRTVNIIKPAGWNYNSVATLARTVAELEAATIAEAMPNDAEDFDVEGATVEQLREFVNRHAPKGRKLPQ